MGELCKQCKEPISKEAKKCIHCGSAQDWKSWINLSSTTTALVLALISVISLASNKIVLILDSEKPNIQILFEDAHNSKATFIARDDGLSGGVVRMESLHIAPDWKQSEMQLSLSESGNYIASKSERLFTTTTHEKTSDMVCQILTEGNYFDKYGFGSWVPYRESGKVYFSQKQLSEMTKGMGCYFSYSITTVDGSRDEGLVHNQCGEIGWIKKCFTHVMSITRITSGSR